MIKVPPIEPELVLNYLECDKARERCSVSETDPTLVGATATWSLGLRPLAPPVRTRRVGVKASLRRANVSASGANGSERESGGGDGRRDGNRTSHNGDAAAERSHGNGSRSVGSRVTGKRRKCDHILAYTWNLNVITCLR